MIPFSGTDYEYLIDIFLRDFLMIFVIGFCFPLIYIKKTEPQGYEVIGITKKKLLLSLIINVVLGVLLTFQFLTKKEPLIFN